MTKPLGHTDLKQHGNSLGRGQLSAGQTDAGSVGRKAKVVTIILPVYNEGGILRANVLEVIAYLHSLADRYVFEVLIIDDGSSDSSLAIAEQLALEHESVTLLRHPRNFGLGQALRYGFGQSTGEYVVVLDVDLSYAPNHIGLLLDRIESTRAKLVLASPYMEGGCLTNVPAMRRFFSVWGNRFLRFFARGGISTLTCMVRAYDGPFVRSMIFKSTGMDIMPEAIYKTMIRGGRIEEIPAHLDWSKQVSAGVRRASSMRIFAHIISTILSGFFFRPFLFLVMPGLLLLAFSAYVNVWMFIHFFDAYFGMDPGARDASGAYALAYAEHPHTFIISLLSLMLAIQVIGLGVLAIQAQKYFEELFNVGAVLRRSIIANAESSLETLGGSSRESE